MPERGEPPIAAAFPEGDSATFRPVRDIDPPVTSGRRFQSEPDRVKKNAAPVTSNPLVVKPGEPMRAIRPFAERATSHPKKNGLRP